jgi:hypothetical protein
MQPRTNRQRRPAASRRIHRDTTGWSWRAATVTPVERSRGDDAITMVEVLVATIVLLITMIPIGILLTNVSSASASARQRQAALQLADSWVEILSNSQPPTGGDGSVLTNVPQTPVAPAGTPTPPTTLAGTTFAVTASYTENLVNDIGQSDLCSAGQPPSPSHPGVIQLKVTVTWNAGAQKLSDTTEINYPKPGLQTEGFLAINLTNDGEVDVNGNQASDRLESLPVTITQTSGSPVLTPNPYTLHADQNGCIFAQVPVGTYDVAILQPTAGTPPNFSGYSGAPPFVNTSGSTTDTLTDQTVTVTAEQTVNLDAFDEGITSSITYGGTGAVDNGVYCPNAASIGCITTGDGTTGASVAWGAGSAMWSSTSLGAGTQINQVDCTTANNADCVGVGYGPTGALIMTTTTDGSALVSDTVPSGVTDLTQVVCPSNRGCYALGLSASGPVLLAGWVGPGTDNWTTVPLPGITPSTLNSMTCPSSSTCLLSYTDSVGAPGILRLDGDPAGAKTPPWSPGLSSDTLPGAVRTVGTVTCPTATTCLALAVGDQAGASDATVVTTTVAATGADAWSAETTFPTGATTVSGISCTASTCVAIGTATGAAAVWTADITGATHGWSQATGFPASVQAVTAVACGNPASGDSADCVVGATTASPSGSGQLIDGSLTNGSWVWNPVTIPAHEGLQYVVGVSCTSPISATATCAAVGATPGGPAVLTTPSGPSGTWSDVTPPSLGSQVVTGIPLETAPSGTAAWTTQVAAGGTPNATTLPDILYPQAPGYSIAAGDCAAEAVSTAIANLNAPPGGSAQVTIPLGLLPLQLVGPTGNPVSGATITLTSTACGGADAYNMPVTDATGVSMASVPYGTYSYTVTQGSNAVAHTSVTITVGAASILVTTAGSTVTDFLPDLAQVQA